jgi:RNA polymerase sigma-70 factor (ECF subfamily)
VHIAPTIGALVGRAAAVSEARGPGAGMALLDAVPADAVATYQPYWALAAHLLARLGRTRDADAARERAVGLCEDPAVRAFLMGRA